MNSNYRKYYTRDLKFHLDVLQKEKGPFQFKLHVYRGKEEQGMPFTEADELEFMNYAEKFNANNFNSQNMDGKLKITFEVKDNADAVECYSFFYKNRRSLIGEIHIYMMNISEETFVKYGDEAAAKYEEDLAKYNAEQE